MKAGREMTRAERFEEEKRRIVDSCFNKKDVDGSRKLACLLMPSGVVVSYEGVCLNRGKWADMTVSQ